MKILLASDHAGFDLKARLIISLTEGGYTVVDKGPTELDPNDDYPDYVSMVAREVSAAPEEARGIVIGGSGQGEAIMANRFPHVRAVVFNGQYAPADGRVVPDEIVLSREHNDANILSLGARFLSVEEARAAVEKWLTTPFPGDERHKRRIEKIDSLSHI